MNSLKSKRALFWAAGVFLLIGGFLVAAIALPFRAEPYGTGAVDVQLPKMVNIPGPWAPNLQLDVRSEPAPVES